MRRSSVRPTDRDCGLVCATASPPAPVQLGARQAATAHARTCRQAGRETTKGVRAARATSIIPPALDTSAPSGISEASRKYTLASGRRSTTPTVAKGPSRPLLDICVSGWGPQREAACRPPEARGGAEGTASVLCAQTKQSGACRGSWWKGTAPCARNHRPRVSGPRRSSHPAPSGPRGARRP